MYTALNSVYWPVVPSQLFDFDEIPADIETDAFLKAIIDFNVPHHKMIARYEGLFHIKNAVIRAKFVGDESCHSFYIREHDKLSVTVEICRNDELLLALMIDNSRIPVSDI